MHAMDTIKEVLLIIGFFGWLLLGLLGLLTVLGYWVEGRNAAETEDDDEAV